MTPGAPFSVADLYQPFVHGFNFVLLLEMCSTLDLNPGYLLPAIDLSGLTST